MIPIKDNNGALVQVGAEIARGGEGAVYEVVSDSSIVAKIYLKPPDKPKAEKLSAMVQSAAPDLMKFAAWPRATLHRNGQLVGLLMKRVAAQSRPIHELYTPKTRLREFPAANWQFLVNVAANITRGFAVVHQTGHVIGDVNHGNILVAPNGITAFIDCDSFQIRANGRLYLCEVGVPTYTPPELQNKAFNHVVRTPDHDCFGLAILIFHLLFMGRHPFAGRYGGTDYMPIERAIAEGRFAFGRLAANMRMSPPPNSLLLNEVSSTLGDAFERAFAIEAGRGSGRPRALEWLKILEEFQRELARCKVNRSHVYFSRINACPWCPIEARGVVLFVDMEVAVVTGLNVEGLWQQIAKLPTLGDLPPVPSFTNRNLSVVPTAEARQLGRSRKLRLFGGMLLVIATLGLTIGLNADGMLTLVLIGVSIGVAYRLQKSYMAKREQLAKELQEAQRMYDQLQSRYRSECADTPFKSQVKGVGELRDQHNQLPLLRQRKLSELENNRFQIQLHEFLDRINLSDARIPSIGPGRKAMLGSYGIDTAADVTYASVTQVPGIGHAFATKLLNWRQKHESRFKFDPSKGIGRAEIERVEREIRTLRTQIEEKIKRGAQEAITSHTRILALRRTYQEKMEGALASLAQANANMRAS